MRFTFSKSGISTSIGGKGFRITNGPRGVYVTTGAGGFYYRQRIGGGTRPARAPRPGNENRDPQFYATDTYSSAGVERLSDVTQDEFVTSLNQWTRRGALQLIALLGIALAFLTAYAQEATERTLWEVGAYGLIAFMLARFVENRRRRFLLVYDLGDGDVTRYARIGLSLEELAKSGSFKAVKMVGHHGDWKRHGGATRALSFESTSLRKAVPPHIVTNVMPWVLSVQGMDLYFFPDRVLIRSRNRFAALSYYALGVSTYTANFVWDAALPGDAQVVGQTWQYVRKDGQPDGRFNNNRQIPLVNVAYLEFGSASGLRAALQTTRVTAAAWVERELVAYSKENQAATSPSRKNLDPEVSAALATLGLAEVPSQAELKKAYRDLAQRNHPDKFAKARLDIRLFAEQRMKEINRAYTLLLSHATSESGGKEVSGPTPGDGASLADKTPSLWRSPEIWATVVSALAAIVVFGTFRAMPVRTESLASPRAVEALPSVVEPVAAPAPKKRVLIACPLRDSPSPKGEQLAVIPKATELELLENKSGWWRVRDSAGAEGWTGPKCWQAIPAKPRTAAKRPGEAKPFTASTTATPQDPYTEASGSANTEPANGSDSPKSKGTIIDPFGTDGGIVDPFN